MASIYPNGKNLYAPVWRCPSGCVVRAHGLGTMDKRAASERWENEKAAHIAAHSGAHLGAVAQQVEQPTFNRLVAGSIPAGPTGLIKFSVAVDAYLDWKAHAITRTTLDAYRSYKRQVIAVLGDPPIGELASRLPAWVAACARKSGRTATVVKRLESIIKPAVRHAYATAGLGVPFVFPEVRSDYKTKGIRRGGPGGGPDLTEQEYLLLRAELPESDVWAGATISEDVPLPSRAPFTIYPRFWLDLAVTTGLHDSDLNRFRATQFNRRDRTWYRDNAKNAHHYPAAWLTCTDHLFHVLDEHLRKHGLGPTALLVADEPPPKQWMRRRLLWAAKRAGLSWVPAPIDLRHTCAQWKRAAGWTEAETALWLANSSGIVREVYAPVPLREIDHAVARARHADRNLIAMTRDLAGPRRGARTAQQGDGLRSNRYNRSEVRSKTTKRKALTHGKQTLHGGGPTD